jgi:hypothetical protein
MGGILNCTPRDQVKRMSKYLLIGAIMAVLVVLAVIWYLIVTGHTAP